MKITELSQLKDGDRVRVKINRRQYFTDAIITVQGNAVFACQNECQGAVCPDTKGYKCSWLLGYTHEPPTDEIETIDEQATPLQPKTTPSCEYITVPLSIAVCRMGDDPLSGAVLAIKRDVDGKAVVMADFGKSTMVVCPEGFETIAKATRDLLKKYEDADLSR